jgi:hypothetical protein
LPPDINEYQYLAKPALPPTQILATNAPIQHRSYNYDTPFAHYVQRGQRLTVQSDSIAGLSPQQHGKSHPFQVHPSWSDITLDQLSHWTSDHAQSSHFAQPQPQPRIVLSPLMIRVGASTQLPSAHHPLFGRHKNRTQTHPTLTTSPLNRSEPPPTRDKLRAIGTLVPPSIKRSRQLHQQKIEPHLPSASSTASSL